MILDNVNRKLQVVLTAAKTTLDMPVIIDYVDNTSTTFTPGTYPSNTNGVTLVDILPAPAASTQRKVNSISIYNYDTAAKVVRVYLNDNGTSYQILDLTLQIDDTLCYTDTQGWYAIDSSGNLKSVQAASATSIANAISSSAEKAIPVGADKVGIVDSVTGLLNWSSFTDMLSWFASLTSVAGYPSIASHATTMDIFAAAGATVGVSGTVTVTAIPNCTSDQVGSAKTIIPSDAAGFSITASASLEVDGATSGTYLMPQKALIEFRATSVSTFKITTIEARGTWAPNQGAGLTVVGAFSSVGVWFKVGPKVTLIVEVHGATSVACSAGGVISSNIPFTSASSPALFLGITTNVGATSVPSAVIYASSTSINANTAISATTGIYFQIDYLV